MYPVPTRFTRPPIRMRKLPFPPLLALLALLFPLAANAAAAPSAGSENNGSDWIYTPEEAAAEGATLLVTSDANRPQTLTVRYGLRRDPAAAPALDQSIDVTVASNQPARIPLPIGEGDSPLGIHFVDWQLDDGPIASESLAVMELGLVRQPLPLASPTGGQDGAI